MPRFLEVKQYLATPYEKQFVMSGHICSATRQTLPFLSIIISFPCRNQNIHPLIHPNTKNNYKKTK
jgi:hypothetical protein